MKHIFKHVLKNTLGAGKAVFHGPVGSKLDRLSFFSVLNTFLPKFGFSSAILQRLFANKGRQLNHENKPDEFRSFLGEAELLLIAFYLDNCAKIFHCKKQ